MSNKLDQNNTNTLNTTNTTNTLNTQNNTNTVPEVLADVADEMIYCLKCQKVTATINSIKRLSKNNRLMLHGLCINCGRKKCKILKYLKSGKGFVNDLLNSGKLPELHLPGHSFTGPGTKLKKRILRGDKPINELDQAAMLHDLQYSLIKDTKERHKYDKQLQKRAFQIAKDKNTTIKDKVEAGIVGSVMFGKRKLGLGVPQN